ncbi:HU family DNA-binding protein [[Kitasatospora] papulosa]|nr:HU family DNA-binding protein [[Kitasatospora] papulosa]
MRLSGSGVQPRPAVGPDVEKGVLRMDRSALIEAVGRRTAGGGELSADQIGRVVDALFGTVAEAGAIAETLRTGGAVTLVGFGSFHQEDGEAALRPGKALNEFVNDEVGRAG